MIPVQNYFHQIDLYKTNIFLLLLTFFFFTGYGRLKNPDYRIFIALLEETRLNNSEENKVCYIKYMIDLQMNQWQIYSNLIRVSLFNNLMEFCREDLGSMTSVFMLGLLITIGTKLKLSMYYF